MAGERAPWTPQRDTPAKASPARQPYPDADPSAGAPVEDWHLLDAVRVLHKRRGTAAVVFLSAVVATAIYVFTAPEVFQSRVQLLIESDQPQVIVFKDTVQEGSESKDYYETQVKILQSRSLARKTMTQLDLWSRPEFGSGDQQGSWLRRTMVGTFNTITSVLPAAIRPGAKVLPVDPPSADDTMARSRALSIFLSELTVTPVKSSRLVDVKFESEDPKLAADVANALADVYIQQDLQSKVEASKQTSDILGKQLEEQKKKLEDSESALQRYRERTESITTGERENLGSQKMAGLNNALVQATTVRLEKEAIFKEVEKLQKDPAALQTFPAILSNALVSGLKGELSDLKRQRAQYVTDRRDVKDPKMVAVDAQIKEAEEELSAEINKAFEGVKREYTSAVAHETTVRNALSEQKRDSVQQQRSEAGYDELERAAKSDRQIFESLLQRTKETGVSGTLRGSNIRVTDPADVPNIPIRPQKVQSLLLAAVTGLMLAVGFAFFFEYFDNRIKTPDEIKAHLGVQCLGLVPLLPTKANGKTETPIISQAVPPNFAEAFRIIRTNVLFTQTTEQIRTMAITSTGPNEGKTMVACNLAVGLALTGERVLLIDADMRRPRVHECFGVTQGPGLSDVITGQAIVKDATRVTSVPSLWLMPCGTAPANPAELLSTARFKKLLKVTAGHFDWVLIDTPPVLAVTDAAIVANIVGGVLFVVGAELTARPTAQTAIEQLRAAQANVLGAVLNRVNLKRNGFFYFNYYRRDYEQYYTPSQPGEPSQPS